MSDRRHRFERTESRLVRRQKRQQPYERMLIVCEGEKTEVNYFTAIRVLKRIPTADIQIVPCGRGTAPMQVVDFAETKFLETKAFDKVYAVFDRDEHASYHAALTKAVALDKRYKNDTGKKVPFLPIPSVPSFELWFLLHFREVREFMSAADVERTLRQAQHYPSYTKASETVFNDTQGQIEVATERASWLRVNFSARLGTEPYTDADVVTGDLLKIANRLE